MNIEAAASGQVLVDGRARGAIPADDRGLLYGDGLFETVAFHAGCAPLWDRHMARLQRGCRVLDLPPPDPELLHAEAGGLAGDDDSAVVRITWTRGSGGHAYAPPADPQPRRILMRRQWPADLAGQRGDGIAVITADHRLCGGELARLKHLNRLDQVLIAAECQRRSAREAVVRNRQGDLAEALTGNLVVVADGLLQTPEPGAGGVEGVGLEWLLNAAGSGIRRARLTPDDLGPDTEIWVINSVTGIRPVSRLDGHPRPISAVCREWQRRWLEFTGELN